VIQIGFEPPDELPPPPPPPPPPAPPLSLVEVPPPNISSSDGFSPGFKSSGNNGANICLAISGTDSSSSESFRMIIL